MSAFQVGAVAVCVLIAGLASVLRRGPLLATQSRPASDPDAVDPIAAALGADRPTWREGTSPAIRSELIVTPGTPSVTPGTPSGLEHSGPSDPTDRD